MAVKRRKFLKLAGGLLGAAALVELGARSGVCPFKGFSVKRPDTDTRRFLGDLPENRHDRAILRMSELDQLPWFETNEDGDMQLKAGSDLPAIIDCHSHVGWSQGFGSDIDMTRRCPVSYFFDHEIPQDFLHVQMHPTEAESRVLSRETSLTLLHTPQRNKTHTAVNLLAEMERFNHCRAALLPVEIPVRSHHMKQTEAAAQLDERLLPFAAIHPRHWSDSKAERLEALVNRTCRGLKFHPVFQFIAPDAKESMALFDWCAAHDVIVLSHTGFTGREPAFMRAFAEPERFRKALQEFPNLKMIFAHTGSRARFKEAFAVAKDYEDQVWLDFTGQPVPNIQHLLDNYDTDKLLYGTDWPYYPLSVSLARFLVATSGREHLRPAILRDNFLQLMGMQEA
ncbi:MAG: amidohydrolase family protein [Candidatus Hydrogenedentes bacterium]|jgi:predicted TIM-barrel fold metal-dependent hydrolase|nr:amidohydrolase family protein [Candidatus Hydrogenedentota bacterium]